MVTYSPQVSTLGRLASHLRIKGQRASAQQACQRPEPLLDMGVYKEGNLTEVWPLPGHNELQPDKRKPGTNARGRHTLTQTTADNLCSVVSLYFYLKVEVLDSCIHHKCVLINIRGLSPGVHPSHLFSHRLPVDPDTPYESPTRILGTDIPG